MEAMNLGESKVGMHGKGWKKERERRKQYNCILISKHKKEKGNKLS